MKPRLWAFGVAGVVFALDRWSKLAIEARVATWDTLVVIPGFFNIIHTRNPGAAFSLLATADPGWRTAVLLSLSFGAVALVSFLLWRTARSEALLRAGLALILGGALGNLYDRLLFGHVIDFLDFHLGGFRWPAFNLADSAITIGAFLVILDLWWKRPRAEGN